jgi:tRNA(Ile)-lysidine synthase
MVRSVIKNRQAFESKLYQVLKNRELSGSRILLGVSGGADSIALSLAMHRLAPKLKFEIEVAHIHHGLSHSSEQAEYRDRAQNFCKNWAEQLGTTYWTERHRGEEIKGEAQLRVVRYKLLESLQKKHGFQYLGLAHHSDDLLETRLIRMIRGVGLGGIASMSVRSKNKLRPLLSFSRDEIIDYLESTGTKYLEDPSNSTLEPLRNWVRTQWLPELEKKRPGSSKSLARSLEILTRRAKVSATKLGRYIEPEGLSRSQLVGLDLTEQRQLLALFLKEKQVQAYSSAQIDEVLKRLRTPQGEFQFVVAKRLWKVTRLFVQLERE